MFSTAVTFFLQAQNVQQVNIVPNLASDVFSGAVLPQEKNNVLYNILNEFTGEPVSYKQVLNYANGTPLTDLKADGVLIRKVNGKYYKLTKQQLTAKDFGVKGDGVSDDYTALQNAINVCSFWGMDLQLSAGTYLFSKTLNLPGTYVASPTGEMPFFTLKISGAGPRVTILKYTGTSGNCFEAIGGAGAFTGGGLQNLYIIGNKTTTGIYIVGRNGFSTHNVWFGTNAIGVLLHNRAPGDFTEYVVQYNPLFDADCVRNLEYRVGDNHSIYRNSYVYNAKNELIDQSFNGSGIVDGYMNLADASDKPILIGNGALPYNAPLSMQFWIRGSNKTIIQSDSKLTPNFHGALTVEEFNSPTTIETATKVGGGNTIAYLGSVQYAGPTRNGTLYLTNSMQTTGPSMGNLITPGIANASYTNIMQHGTDTVKNIIAHFSTEPIFVVVTVSKQMYDCRYLLLCTQQGSGGNGLITVINTIRQYAADNITSPPEFTMAANDLIVKVHNYNGTSPAPISIHVNTLPIGNSLNEIR